MEFRKLEVFCKVVELKSFTKAADETYLTQPTVSEHIRSLEDELEHKLFNRLGKEVELTPVGDVLYGYAVKILQKRQEAIQAVAHFSGTLAGKISIGSGTIPGTYILPELISSFHRKYPSTKAVLRITSSRVIAEKVLHGDLEFGIVGARWNENKLTWSDFYSDELTLAVPPEHPWAGKETVSLKEAVGLSYVLREPESGTRRYFAGILEEASIREKDLEVVAEIGSTAAVKEAVKAGIGVSVLSKLAVAEDVESGKLAALAIDGLNLRRPFYIVCRKNRELSPTAAAFVDFIKSE